jgi:hypothetical protein
MNVERKKLNIGLFILILYSLSTIFSDIDSVHQELIKIFYAVKIPILLSFVGLLIVNWTCQVSVKNVQKMFLILILVYCLLGEVFCPGYHLGFIQAVLSAVFIYDVSRKFNLGYILTFGVLYFIVFSYFGTINQAPIGYDSYLFDIKVAIFSVTALSFFLYNEISKFKAEKEQLSKKYEALGKNVSFLVHDLKSKTLGPTLTVDSLLYNKEDYSSEEYQEMLGEVKGFLLDLKTSFKKVNELVNISHLEMVNIHKIIDSKSQETLGKIEYAGDDVFKGVPDIFESIFHNLLKNSNDNFIQKGTQDPIIRITVKKNYIIYSDNGGGFPIEFLEKMNQGIPLKSSKVAGNGIGIYSVYESVALLNGSVVFYNKGNSACVKMNF